MQMRNAFVIRHNTNIIFYKHHIQFLISNEYSSRHNRYNMCSIGTGQLVTHASNFLGQLVICDELTDTRFDHRRR